MIARLYFDMLSAAVCCPKCRISCRFLYIVLRPRHDSLYSLSLVFIENYTKRAEAYSHAQYTIFFWKKPHYPEQLHPFPFIDSIFSRTYIRTHIRTHTHTYMHTHTARVAAVHTHSPPTRVCVRSWRLAIGDSQMVGIRKGARVGAATILAHGVSCVVSEWKPVSHSVKRQVEHAAVAISASSSFVYSRNKEKKKRGHLEWVQIFLAIL